MGCHLNTPLALIFVSKIQMSLRLKFTPKIESIVVISSAFAFNVISALAAPPPRLADLITNELTSQANWIIAVAVNDIITIAATLECIFVKFGEDC